MVEPETTVRETGRAGAAGDLLRLFTAPGALFASLRARPRFAAILVLLLVVIVAGAVVTLGPLTNYLIEEGLREGGAADRATLERVFEHPAFRIVFVTVLLPGRFLVGSILLAGISLLLLSLTGGAGRTAPFRSLFAVVIWSKAVWIPYSFLWVYLFLRKGTPQIFFGPALLVGETKGILFAFLRTLDLFSLWFLVLFVLGIRIVFDLPSKRAWMVALPGWLLLGLTGLA